MSAAAHHTAPSGGKQTVVNLPDVNRSAPIATRGQFAVLRGIGLAAVFAFGCAEVHIKMMRCLIVLVVSVLCLAPPVTASPIDATANNNFNTLLTALLGSTSGLTNFGGSVVGDPSASGLFSGGPFGLGSGVMLSTGTVTNVEGANTSGSAGNDLGAAGAGGDTTTLTITFDSDASVAALFFTYVFGSEEFYEFIGSNFNDSFSLSLDGVNYAKLTCGADVQINNFTGSCLNDLVNNAGGTETQLDAFTIPLVFSAPLSPGGHTLVLSIADVGDGIYDSAVFVKGGTLGVVDPSGVPEPATLSLLGIGLAGLGARRWRKR